jgi:hypothetical protein
MYADARAEQISDCSAITRERNLGLVSSDQVDSVLA